MAYAVLGLPPKLTKTQKTLFSSRINNAMETLHKDLPKELLSQTKITIIDSSQLETFTANSQQDQTPSTSETTEQYFPIEPYFTIEQLILEPSLYEKILNGVELIEVQEKVFEQWGLKIIEPFPRTALNFYGLPGTGKTLTAHAIAHRLGKKIIIASYAQIESKYLGDAPKNIEALFKAAEYHNAVLFIDEAESLLSKRLTNVSQGSERAANSLTSQLLICLEKFSGVVIFASNLVENYDKAFETRVRHIHFPMPNEEARQQIWQKHLPTTLPLAEDVSLEALAKIEDVCGRDIKNAVIDAAVKVARQKRDRINLNDLVEAIEHIKEARISTPTHSLTPAEEAKVRDKILSSATASQDSPNGHS